MDYVLNKINKKKNKVENNKLETVQVLDKEKLIKELKMLEIKFNFNNNYKEIKINRKIKMQMQIKNNKMIYKWKVILKVICILSSNNNKMMIKVNLLNKNSHSNKWVKLTINKDRKI